MPFLIILEKIDLGMQKFAIFDRSAPATKKCSGALAQNKFRFRPKPIWCSGKYLDFTLILLRFESHRYHSLFCANCATRYFSKLATGWLSLGIVQICLWLFSKASRIFILTSEGVLFIMKSRFAPAWRMAQIGGNNSFTIEWLFHSLPIQSFVGQSHNLSHNNY